MHLAFFDAALFVETGCFSDANALFGERHTNFFAPRYAINLPGPWTLECLNDQTFPRSRHVHALSFR
jgi:hypothetical protein